MSKYHTRWMIRRDMTSVLMIENQNFEFPWSESDFLNWLRQRNVIGMVAENDYEDVVGFALYELHQTRLHVINLAVDIDHKRSGVGRAIVDKLTSKLGDRRSRVTVEVRESNLACHLFFKSQGFTATEIIRRPYEESDEDAYLFEFGRRAERPVESGGRFNFWGAV